MEVIILPLLGVLLVLSLYLLAREIVCWYLKINEAICLLKSIDHKLDRLPNPAPPVGEEENRRG